MRYFFYNLLHEILEYSIYYKSLNLIVFAQTRDKICPPRQRYELLIEGAKKSCRRIENIIDARVR